jgi:dihydroxy-acid dehydratase
MRRGNPDSAFTGTRPQIAILNTASDLTPCNMHLDEVAQSVKNGIWEAGGIPHNLPMLSLGETNLRPTAMLWRNLAAMAAEEMIRGNPIDGVVLLGGCDKTIPSLLMDQCLTERLKERSWDVAQMYGALAQMFAPER